MSALAADDRICHVYRNRENYPSEANPMKYAEEIDDDGTMEDMEICGLRMVQLGDTGWWYCVECDRPRNEWPVRPPTA